MILSAILRAEESNQPGNVKKENVLTEVRLSSLNDGVIDGATDENEFLRLSAIVVDAFVGLANLFNVFSHGASPQTE